VNVFGQVGALAPGGSAAAADLFDGETAHLASDWTLDTGTLDLACNTATFDGTDNLVATAYDGSGDGTNRWCMTDTGDAAEGDILSGKKAWVDGSEVTGNVVAGSNVPGSDGAKSFTIPDGLYSGSKQATANDTDLVADNIKDSVNIFGVVGTFAGGAGVPDTGQTTLYRTGDDGDLERGVAWPNPRFTDNGDDTVTDNLTGLMWTKNANLWQVSWNTAIDNCNDHSVAGYTDWRLPNVRELQSLVHYGVFTPAVPNTAGTGQWSAGDPFDNVQSSNYWSSTTCADNTANAWYVYLSNGLVFSGIKTSTYYVWPVRGGQ